MKLLQRVQTLIPFHALLPVTAAVVMLIIWQFVVIYFGISRAILPTPFSVFITLITERHLLCDALFHTAVTTYEAFVISLCIAMLFAFLFCRFPLLEATVAPFAVLLQVTPVIAIAPLILIWVGIDNGPTASLIIAAIVSFFPLLANTTVGLRSSDLGLRDMMQLNRASYIQIFYFIELPSAVPFILVGMKISIGLALIGSVVAEFVAGSGTNAGLAWVILEASSRLNAAMMFASLSLLCSFGIMNFIIIGLLQHALLHRWHESAISGAIR